MDGNRMNEIGVRQQVIEIAEAVFQRTAELAPELAHTIVREVPAYQPGTPLPFDVVVDGCAGNLRAVFSAIAADSDFDPTVAATLGADRAREGVPLSSVMEAYRIGFRLAWEAVVAECETQACDAKALRTLTAKVFAAQDVFTGAMAVGYRDEQARQMLNDQSARAVLIDSLLQGRLIDQSSLWEAADRLRLPSVGPFVIIAADVLIAGTEALPGIESKLRSIDVFSAWRLLPDQQIGIVHVKADLQLGNVLALVSRLATSRVGVSAHFDDLREAPQALRFARVMLRGRPQLGTPVAVFDGSILATAAASAPEVMVNLVSATLQGFADLADNEREILFETFRVWLETDGSLRATGELLFCHPNTVRYRLHRIEQRTGRSLSRPRDVAELCVAFEVHRLLMVPAPIHNGREPSGSGHAHGDDRLGDKAVFRGVAPKTAKEDRTP
jgi:PucR C-terminal helix-turn-helix domain/GGDEF-like domain